MKGQSSNLEKTCSAKLTAETTEGLKIWWGGAVIEAYLMEQVLNLLLQK